MSEHAGDVLAAQTRAINKLVRMYSINEVNCYVIKEGKVNWAGLRRFSIDNTQETKLGDIRFRVGNQVILYKVKIIIVRGHLFEFKYSRDFSQILHEQIIPIEVEIHPEFMRPPQGPRIPDQDLDKCSLWHSMGISPEESSYEAYRKRIVEFEKHIGFHLPHDLKEMLLTNSVPYPERISIRSLRDMATVFDEEELCLIVADIESGDGDYCALITQPDLTFKVVGPGGDAGMKFINLKEAITYYS